jgi:hypothetical protein
MPHVARRGLYARLHRTQSDVEPDPNASIPVEA